MAEIVREVTPAEWADAKSLKVRTVRKWLRDERIPTARKVGRVWRIPADAPLPAPPDEEKRAREGSERT